MSRRFRWFRQTGRAITFSALIGLFGLIGCGSYSSADGGHTSAEVGFSATYSDLNPYGHWVLSAQFGQVWCPDNGSGWAPFSDGYWDWTDRGWFWQSDEPYGWLVYHYGNWYYDDQYGWCWVPGDSWSPATVQWVAYDNYVCWAPLPPRGVTLAEPWETSRARMWNVVLAANFTDENASRVQVNVNTTRPFVPARVVRHSPDIKVINRQVERPIMQVTVKRQPTPAGRKTLFKAIVPLRGEQRALQVKSVPPKTKAQEVDRKGEKKNPKDRGRKSEGSGD